MSLRHIDITQGPGDQRPTVAVDGKDISDDVQAVAVLAEQGQFPTVRLTGRAGADLHLVADVTAVAGADFPDELESFLDGLDPATVERDALNRPDMANAPHAVTAAILRQLVDYVRGA